MFTSHETLADYIHFWGSFLEVYAEEGLNLDKLHETWNQFINIWKKQLLIIER